MNEQLTDRQREVLVAWAKANDDGAPPTLRELGAAIGLKSVNGVHELLAALERKGWLVKLPNKARGYRLTDRGADWWYGGEGAP